MMMVMIAAAHSSRALSRLTTRPTTRDGDRFVVSGSPPAGTAAARDFVADQQRRSAPARWRWRSRRDRRACRCRRQSADRAHGGGRSGRPAAAIASAPAWVDMCQPSASSAIEPKIVPPAISATIIAAVSADHQPGAPLVALVAGPRKTWSCRHAETEWPCMGELLRSTRAVYGEPTLRGEGFRASTAADRQLGGRSLPAPRRGSGTPN